MTRSQIPVRTASSRSRPIIGTGAIGRSPASRRRTEGEPRADRRALALREDRLGRAVLDGVARRGVRLLADEDGAHRSGGLQSCGRVHDVSCDHRLAVPGAGLELDDRLAGVHGDAHLEAVLLGPVANGECRADRALGVVAVGRRRAEDAHDRVADELLDRAAVALELLADALVVRREDRADVLRIELLGTSGEADEVDEQDGDDAALLAGPPGLGERRAARVAELREVGVLLAAARAGRARPGTLESR